MRHPLCTIAFLLRWYGVISSDVVGTSFRNRYKEEGKPQTEVLQRESIVNKRNISRRIGSKDEMLEQAKDLILESFFPIYNQSVIEDDFENIIKLVVEDSNSTEARLKIALQISDLLKKSLIGERVTLNEYEEERLIQYILETMNPQREKSEIFEEIAMLLFPNRGKQDMLHSISSYYEKMTADFFDEKDLEGNVTEFVRSSFHSDGFFDFKIFNRPVLPWNRRSNEFAGLNQYLGGIIFELPEQIFNLTFPPNAKLKISEIKCDGLEVGNLEHTLQRSKRSSNVIDMGLNSNDLSISCSFDYLYMIGNLINRPRGGATASISALAHMVAELESNDFQKELPSKGEITSCRVDPNIRINIKGSVAGQLADNLIFIVKPFIMALFRTTFCRISKKHGSKLLTASLQKLNKILMPYYDPKYNTSTRTDITNDDDTVGEYGKKVQSEDISYASKMLAPVMQRNWGFTFDLFKYLENLQILILPDFVNDMFNSVENLTLVNTEEVNVTLTDAQINASRVIDRYEFNHSSEYTLDLHYAGLLDFSTRVALATEIKDIDTNSDLVNIKVPPLKMETYFFGGWENGYSALDVEFSVQNDTPALNSFSNVLAFACKAYPEIMLTKGELNFTLLLPEVHGLFAPGKGVDDFINGIFITFFTVFESLLGVALQNYIRTTGVDFVNAWLSHVTKGFGESVSRSSVCQPGSSDQSALSYLYNPYSSVSFPYNFTAVNDEVNTNIVENIMSYDGNRRRTSVLFYVAEKAISNSRTLIYAITLITSFFTLVILQSVRIIYRNSRKPQRLEVSRTIC